MPKVKPRKISYGEKKELKRIQTWAAKRNQLSNVKPNKNTMGFQPPSYGSVAGWSQDNG